MRKKCKEIGSMTLWHPVALLLSSLLLFFGCRIRRERPNTQPAVQVTTGAVSSAYEAGAPMAPASTTEPTSIAASPVQPPDSPVLAPDGVVVVTATSAYVEASTIKRALDSVRIATLRLLEGASGSAAAMSGLIPLERALDVPVANGAPLRRNNERPQCDAVLIDTRGRLFGVGAVADLESPARLALEVYERNWGLVVGYGAQTLAAQIGIVGQRWSLEVDQQTSVASDQDMDAGGRGPAESNGKTAGVAQEHEPNDVALSKSNIEDAGTAPSDANPPSTAVVMLRDREGRFFVAAEDCGVLGAPVGQLTTLSREGTALFVGEEGAVFVAGGSGLAREARHAERIYRRLVMLQVPKVTADWGLLTTEGAAWVIIVSRLGSAIASREPVVWARNHADGESSSQVPSPRASAVVAAPFPSARVGADGIRPMIKAQPPSPVESSVPVVDRATQSRLQTRDIESAATSAPKSVNLIPRASERDAG